jgi:hypothetical protein
MFSSWILLDSSVEFKQIVEVTSQNIWAQSDDGKIYSWNFNCYLGPKCNEWIKTEAVPADLHEFGEQPMEKSNSCQAVARKPIKEPPSKEVECARGQYAGPEYGESVYYALLGDGSLWALRTSSSLIVVYVLPIYFSFGGLILGIIASIVFMIWRRRSNKPQIVMESKP